MAAESKSERPREKWREWLLLDADRTLVAGVTAFALFAFVASVSLSGLAPFVERQPVFYVYGGLLSGNLTVITVVVSISQLLLSRQLNTPSELRSQMEGVIDYRKDVEDAAGRVAPVEPLGFLRLLVENTRKRSQELGGLTIAETNDEVYAEVDAAVSRVTRQVDTVDGLLQESDASTFHVLSATLTTNYARDINHLRRIKSEYEESVPAHVEESIDLLIDRLQQIDVARQYFKSVYLEQQLAELSRMLFYAGLPSVAVVAVSLLLFTAAGGTSVSPPYERLLIPATVTVGLVPLSVLFAYILRIATVTQRTAATVPFTTPEQER
ncbi:hypothetical protein SAMN04488063_1453 [Halopelagius inordinatus]|uniref:Uncharacterized protein n=1 Tax=Halopelagius inordinatus TaxID=553467 RepID=A0A1I2PB00_9EURY|nr:hypothetical protein [Halopelagius inordinatus]SFG11137.1 hypothetical protein SAMN04488063_1453 [Halopelagius inordinatus]